MHLYTDRHEAREMVQQVKVIAAKPEFNLWGPNGGKREPTSESCPLISTGTL